VEAEVESVVRDQAPELGPPVRSMLGPTLDARAGARTAQVRLAARDGFDAHLRVLDRATGGAVWLTDTTARSLGVRAGQTVRLGGRSLPCRSPASTGIWPLTVGRLTRSGRRWPAPSTL
jgi:hypothetical protein